MGSAEQIGVAPGRPGQLHRFEHRVPAPRSLADHPLILAYTACGVPVFVTWVLAPENTELRDGRGARFERCKRCWQPEHSSAGS